MFINLVSNAIKHDTARSPTGTIAFHVRRGATSASVSVSDNGPGVPRAIREAIFEKSARGGAAGQAGAGLGLAISRQIVTAFGGTPTAVKRPQGGHAFAIGLPLTQPTPPESGTG